MDDMLRQLQAQFAGGTAARGGSMPAPPPRTESKRDRLRREQEEIRARYLQQRETPEEP